MMSYKLIIYIQSIFVDFNGYFSCSLLQTIHTHPCIQVGQYVRHFTHPRMQIGCGMLQLWPHTRMKTGTRKCSIRQDNAFNYYCLLGRYILSRFVAKIFYLIIPFLFHAALQVSVRKLRELCYLPSFTQMQTNVSLIDSREREYSKLSHSLSQDQLL